MKYELRARWSLPLRVGRCVEVELGVPGSSVCPVADYGSVEVRENSAPQSQRKLHHAGTAAASPPGQRARRSIHAIDALPNPFDETVCVRASRSLSRSLSSLSASAAKAFGLTAQSPEGLIYI